MTHGSLICSTANGRDVELDLAALLSPALLEQTRVDANAWIKRFRLVPFGSQSMRQRFRYQNDSLWWFTELYLHKMRRLETAVSTVLALEAARESHHPTRVRVQSPDSAVRDAAIAFGHAHRLAVEVSGTAKPRPSLAWPSYLIGLSARLSRARTAAISVERRPAVVAFVHTAFWRATAGKDGPQQESYVGAVLDAVTAGRREGDLFCVGVGPRRNFRTRRWWDPVTTAAPGSRLITPIERLAPSAALTGSFALWRTRRALARDLTSGDAIRAAASYRSCDLWDVVRPELEAVAMLQWPWSARAMDEAGAAIETLAPGAIVTYAEAGGWGRALMLEARRRGIASVGLQHGFIYRHWLNYRHEPDEMAADGPDRGCPIPDRTLLFDKYAEQHLLEAGHFPSASVAVTGNARLDDLVAQCDALRPSRNGIRRDLGVTPGQPLLVLAAKFSEVSRVLPDLVSAVAALPDMRLVVKPHPADTPEDYRPATTNSPNITIAGSDADLATLLTASDAIVTMNSTVAIDGLVLGVPSLVIGLPNNLTPFVEAGAMLGANGVDAIRGQIHALLYDREARRAIAAAGEAFAGRYQLASDGRAARRAADEILALAAHPAARRPSRKVPER